MTINSMRTTLDAWCAKRNDCESNPCTHCPVGNIENVCSSYNWANAPEDLIEKAYLLAFGEIKEDEQMNNVEEAIRKTLEMVKGVVKAGNEVFVVGYIIGVWELTKKLTENKKEANK